jgi:ketosteroid isomerase-like protein
MAGSPLQPSVDTDRQGAPDPREELRRVLAAMSAAWQGRRYDSLAQVFADNMVFALPASSARLEGARAVVESYREFMDRVTLTEYREEDPCIDIWGDTAVVTYRWEMAWLAGNVPNREAGHDVFVFRRDPGAPWRAVWRTMSFEPSAQKPHTPTS